MSKKPRKKAKAAAAAPTAATAGTSEPAELLRIGALGTYVVSEPLGDGGMGQVHLATRLKGNGPVRMAIKRPLRAGERALELFNREARALGRVKHRNVCRLHAFIPGDAVTLPTIAMEYVEHDLSKLSQALRKRPELSQAPPAQRIKAFLIAQAARGVAAAHAAHIVHRDLKPANLLIDTDGVVKVTDFGVARLLDATRQTTTGAARGSWAYMAPEQVLNASSVSPASDVWALGVCLWELLTDRDLFHGGNPAADALAITQGPAIPPVQELAEGVDERLGQIVAGALKRDAKERTRDAITLAKELDEYLRQDPGEADVAEWIRVLGLTPSALFEKSQGGAKGSSRPVARWLAAASVIGLVALTSGLVAFAMRDSATSPPRKTRDDLWPRLNGAALVGLSAQGGPLSAEVRFDDNRITYVRRTLEGEAAVSEGFVFGKEYAILMENDLVEVGRIRSLGTRGVALAAQYLMRPPRAAPSGPFPVGPHLLWSDLGVGVPDAGCGGWSHWEDIDLVGLMRRACASVPTSQLCLLPYSPVEVAVVDGVAEIAVDEADEVPEQLTVMFWGDAARQHFSAPLETCWGSRRCRATVPAGAQAVWGLGIGPHSSYLTARWWSRNSRPARVEELTILCPGLSRR